MIGMITSMSVLCENSSSWTDTWNEVQNICSSHDIMVASHGLSSRRKIKQFVNYPPCITQALLVIDRKFQGNHRQEVSREPSDTFRIVLFIPAVDRILRELKCRLPYQSFDIISSISSVISLSSLKFLIFYHIVPLLSVYAETYVIN
jgi:hypothetical protein